MDKTTHIPSVDGYATQLAEAICLCLLSQENLLVETSAPSMPVACMNGMDLSADEHLHLLVRPFDRQPPTPVRTLPQSIGGAEVEFLSSLDSPRHLARRISTPGRLFILASSPLSQWSLAEAVQHRFGLRLKVDITDSSLYQQIAVMAQASQHFHSVDFPACRLVVSEILRSTPEVMLRRIVQLVRQCRPQSKQDQDAQIQPASMLAGILEKVTCGPSPRATRALFRLSAARACMQGRRAIEDCDIVHFLPLVLPHHIHFEKSANEQLIDVLIGDVARRFLSTAQA